MNITEYTASFENDCEVESLSLKSPSDQDEKDKPLSPILNSSLCRSRKFIGGRNQRKTRIKLSNRFQTEKKEKHIVEQQIQLFNEDNFTLSSTDCDNLERLEEIEKNRELAYKWIIQNKNNCVREKKKIDLNQNKKDLCFKKPISPAPKRKIKPHIQSNFTCKEDEQDFANQEDEFECKTLLLAINDPIELPKTSNFQTATGKEIEISPEKLQYHSKLFEDILSCSQTQSQRKNKYSCLKKSHSIELDNKNIKVTESVSEGEELSLTQAIGDSGISNTQILCAVDNLLTNISNIPIDVDGFKGFTTADILESEILLKKIQTIIDEKGELNGVPRRKRNLQEFDFLPNKRLKIEFPLYCNNNDIKGFTMASGSGISHRHEDVSNSEKRSSTNNYKKSNNIKDKLRFFDDFIGGDNINNGSLENTSTKDIIQSPFKKVKVEPCFNPANLNFGFSKASGQKINAHLNKTNSIFGDIDLSDLKNMNHVNNKKSESENNPNSVNLQSCGFATASGLNFSVNKPSSLSEERFKDIQKSNVERPLSEKNCFQTSITTNNRATTFKNVSSSAHLNRSIPNFNNQPDNIQNIPEFKNSKCYVPVKDKLKYFDQLIGDDCDFVPKSSSNVPTTSKSSSITRPFVKQKLEFFDDLLGKNEVLSRNNSFQNLKMPQNFTSAGGKSLQLSSNALKRASAIFDDILDKDISTSNSFGTPAKNSNESSTKKGKKKLGVSALKQISIPESKLQKAKLLFDEDFTGISPIKPLVPQNLSACQGFSSCSTPLRNFKKSESFTDDSKSIRNETRAVDVQKEVFKLGDDCFVTFDKPEAVNAVDLVKNFDEEVKRLEERLVVMKRRCEAIESMRIEKLDCDKKPKHGTLYTSKKEKARTSLNQFVCGRQPKEHSDDDLFSITPQNAGDVHFKESSATIVTEDGATVVPNVKDLIGLHEVENAFTTMPGTDPRLVPKNWIKNHYKWIIWKLTSYERMFPEYFKGALQVEHVIQQLKYRYDREIDKAERPALRRILEKDDAPQKRMILCVSDIKKIGFNSFELELTDGWYGIRTVVDEPLSLQILANKIIVGTKLLIFGAELINCDGCHPLEVTDLTFLKINYNCTRRARWDAKLGYQKFPGPFPVPVHTVQPNGGSIGCINICIARSYPFRYLEKSVTKSVWRNKKAEERRSQNWENERHKKFEEIEETIRRELSSEGGLNKGKRNTNEDITGIACPKTLLEIVENSNDPDGVEEQLTASQKTSLLAYKRNLFVERQQEMASKVKSSAEKLKMARREVVPVMKLLVVDLNGSPTKAYNFFLWRPTECHVQMLREGSCHSVFNVHPKLNGDLNSSTKTMFKEKPDADHMSDIFKRKLIVIEELNDLKFSRNFNEFDTVGVVVQILIETDGQEMWMCDASGRLLFVKIYEGPGTCLLLDNLRRGQITSACNLVYSGRSEELMICRASANHSTVFSAYPKFRHLQDGLENLKMEIPKEFDGVLKDCDSRIERYRLKQSPKMLDETLEDSTLISSRITSTDIALSLIDMDKYF